MTQYKEYKLIVTSTVNKPGLTKKDIVTIETLLNKYSTTDLIFKMEEIKNDR